MLLDTQTLTRLSIMVLIPVILAIIPFKLDRYALMRLAFAIWMSGGIILSKSNNPLASWCIACLGPCYCAC
jgi:hypothetical protein